MYVTTGVRGGKKKRRSLWECRQSENHFRWQLNTDYFGTGMSHPPSLKQDLKKFFILHYASFRMSTNSPGFGCSHLSPSPGQWRLFFSRFCGVLGREVFVWLSSLHKKLKVNTWLSKISFMWAYLFQCIEGLNKYLPV